MKELKITIRIKYIIPILKILAVWVFIAAIELLIYWQVGKVNFIIRTIVTAPYSVYGLNWSINIWRKFKSE